MIALIGIPRRSFRVSAVITANRWASSEKLFEETVPRIVKPIVCRLVKPPPRSPTRMALSEANRVDSYEKYKGGR